MADLTTPAAITTAATGLSLASILPGIDGNALIGSFAGATLFVMSAKELGAATRIGYLLISLIMGYLAAPEIVRITFIQESGVAGFLSGVLCITLTLQLTKRLESTDLVTLLSQLRGGGKR
ncbi:putative holin [Motiliproteus sp.]|uniref:putative holin n=1 Tax=Motiliproteus sp. TaxID=1898955 RepID=UPI003BAAA921